MASMYLIVHGAIFLATCNAILLLRDVNLANTRLRYILPVSSIYVWSENLVAESEAKDGGN